MKKQLMRLAMAVGLLLSGCQDPNIEPMMADEPSMEEVAMPKKTVLGKKLNNPYSLSNMQLALERLREKGKTNKTAETLTPTDYYVRFFPENADELELLRKDSLALYGYPLDYEIDSVGDYYDTGGNPLEGKWHYTSVPVAYQFPSVKYEVIEELFLPETILEDNGGQRNAWTADFLHDLEAEAFAATGNELRNSHTMRTMSVPSGFVRVWDTERQALVGVSGVKVRTRRWFSYGVGYTNAYGYYRVDNDYSRDVHYTVFFENLSGFTVWSSILDLAPASHSVGDHSPSGLNIDIYQNSRAWPFATVNNATVKYRNYCTQFGIGLPDDNLRIAATDSEGSSSAPMLRRTWGFYGFTSHSDLLAFLGKANGLSLAATAIATIIKFAQPDLIIAANSSKGTTAVYATTFHELGHASHFAKVGSPYWIRYINYIITYNEYFDWNRDGMKSSYGDGLGNNAGLCAIGEAWSNYIGYTLVLEEYKNTPVPGFPTASLLDNSYVRWNALEQFTPLEPINGDKNRSFSWGASFSNTTQRASFAGWIPAGIMHDLMDDNNPQEFIRTSPTQNYWDNASGYSIREFYNALDNDVDTPQKFRDRLLSENANRDEADVRHLFEAYFRN